jgi:hypothetical protein
MKILNKILKGSYRFVIRNACSRKSFHQVKLATISDINKSMAIIVKAHEIQSQSCSAYPHETSTIYIYISSLKTLESIN